MMKVIIVAGAALLVSTPCWALRPFDSTDADVAKVQETEIELGPLGYFEQGGSRFLSGPLLVWNYGFAQNAELVVQGQYLRQIDSPRRGGAKLADTGISVKQILREGVLQDRPGTSFAVEYGLVLPEVRGDHGTGASIAGIASQRWGFGTVHWNAMLALTRTHHLQAFTGAIYEGPEDWKIRPVAEVFVERERSAHATTARSGLIGIIWPHGDKLALDLGIRWAREENQAVRELRTGLTFNFSGG